MADASGWLLLAALLAIAIMIYYVASIFEVGTCPDISPSGHVSTHISSKALQIVRVHSLPRKAGPEPIANIPAVQERVINCGDMSIDIEAPTFPGLNLQIGHVITIHVCLNVVHFSLAYPKWSV